MNDIDNGKFSKKKFIESAFNRPERERRRRRSRNPAALESRARHAAKRAGLIAQRSRRGISGDNFGEFMLVDPDTNCIVAGSRYELTPEEVIEFCFPVETEHWAEVTH